MNEARKFTRRVTVLEIVETPDGFGGTVITHQTQCKAWARVEDLSKRGSRNATDYGLTDFSNSYMFTFRYNGERALNALKNKIQYKGNNYDIVSLLDTDILNRQVKVVAKMEQPIA